MSQQTIRTAIIECLQADPSNVVALANDSKQYLFLLPAFAATSEELMELLALGLEQIHPHHVSGSVLRFKKGTYDD